MAREFAEAFYRSSAWKSTRSAYVEYRHGLCERCMRRGIVRPGVIVHHKKHLTPRNINDPNISLSWENLELVCRDCHGFYHSDGAFEPRVAFDENGNVVKLGDT